MNEASFEREWDGGTSRQTIVSPAPVGSAPASAITPAPASAVNPFSVFNSVPWDGTEDSLPKDYAGLLKLRLFYFGELNSRQFASRAEFIEADRRRKILAAALAKAENPPRLEIIPRIPSTAERHVGRTEWRANVIVKLKEALDSDHYTTAPLKISNSVHPFILEAFRFAEYGLGSLVASLLPRVAKYALAYFEAYPQVFVEDRIEEVKLALSAAGSLKADEFLALQNELLRLESSGAAIISQSLRAKLIQDFAPLKSDLDVVNMVAVVAIQEMKAAAESREKIFFSGNGLPHEVTSVSRQYDTILKPLEAAVSNLTKMEPHALQPTRPIDPRHNGLARFGVEVLPGYF